MTWEDPVWLAVALAAAALSWWLSGLPRASGVRFPTLSGLRSIKPAPAAKARALPRVLRVIALVCLGLALSRPRHGLEETQVHAEGIDIMMAIDISTSMLAEDFSLGNARANRLQVIQHVIHDFVGRRKYDRIGAVIFAGRPYTLCPLTLDYGMLLQLVDRTRIGMVEDGTAVGSAIVTALNRLKKSDARSRILILLTDGRSNMGNVDPLTAAQLASRLGVRIYTIGAGSKGPVPYPVRDAFGRPGYQWIQIDLDESTLRQIAERTGGRYFAATDTATLSQIYRQIDLLEKSKIDAPLFTEYKEYYPWFVLAALVLLLAEWTLARTRLCVLP